MQLKHRRYFNHNSNISVNRSSAVKDWEMNDICFVLLQKRQYLKILELHPRMCRAVH